LRAFNIKFIGKVFMMLQMGQPKGVPAAEAKRLQSRQKSLVNTFRKMQGPVNQVVRSGSVREKHQPRHGERRQDVVVGQRERPKQSETNKRTQERDSYVNARYPQQVFAQLRKAGQRCAVRVIHRSHDLLSVAPKIARIRVLIIACGSRRVIKFRIPNAAVFSI
jgi:hypothetical protein